MRVRTSQETKGSACSRRFQQGCITRGCHRGLKYWAGCPVVNLEGEYEDGGTICGTLGGKGPDLDVHEDT